MSSFYIEPSNKNMSYISDTMSNVEPSSRLGVALDLILKTLIASQDFNDLATKNWDAIARLITGMTAGQVYMCIQ